MVHEVPGFWAHSMHPEIITFLFSQTCTHLQNLQNLHLTKFVCIQYLRVTIQRIQLVNRWWWELDLWLLCTRGWIGWWGKRRGERMRQSVMGYQSTGRWKPQNCKSRGKYSGQGTEDTEVITVTQWNCVVFSTNLNPTVMVKLLEVFNWWIYQIMAFVHTNESPS